jgi:hypothetical protein
LGYGGLGLLASLGISSARKLVLHNLTLPDCKDTSQSQDGLNEELCRIKSAKRGFASFVA